MLIPKPSDAIHKAQLIRLLTAICDNKKLAPIFLFKGGTCAAMRGLINRFSVDLDFDMKISKSQLLSVRKELEKIFADLELEIKDYSKKTIQYFLKYQSADNARNTLKLDALIPPPKNNDYELVNLPDIDRTMWCQTTETMVANKLVAVLDRFQKTEQIAGRDIYDINIFLAKGFAFNEKIITERTGLTAQKYLQKLIRFIEKNVNQTIINQDLNLLLPINEFKKIRKTLKQEVLILLNDSLKKYQ